VGRLGIGPSPCRLKGGCTTLVLTSLAFFWARLHGRGLRFRFHRRLLRLRVLRVGGGVVQSRTA
jgi:hypothetical protein